MDFKFHLKAISKSNITLQIINRRALSTMLMEHFHLPANSESKPCVITRSKVNIEKHDIEKNDQKPWRNPQSIHLSEAQASLCKIKGLKKASMSTAHSRITTFCIVFQRNFKESFLLKNTVREIKNGISRQA
jgi:hypothetical protein